MEGCIQAMYIMKRRQGRIVRLSSVLSSSKKPRPRRGRPSSTMRPGRRPGTQSRPRTSSPPRPSSAPPRPRRARAGSARERRGSVRGDRSRRASGPCGSRGRSGRPGHWRRTGRHRPRRRAVRRARPGACDRRCAAGRAGGRRRCRRRGRWLCARFSPESPVPMGGARTHSGRR